METIFVLGIGLFIGYRWALSKGEGEPLVPKGLKDSIQRTVDKL